MRILVTGAAGFIGSAIVRNLLLAYEPSAQESAVLVTAVDSLVRASGWHALEASQCSRRVTLEQVDVRDTKHFASLTRGHDIVIHCAAETSVDKSFDSRATFFEVNVNGSRSVAEAAKNSGVGVFIHFSTDEVYGERLDGRTTEEANLRPTNPYSESKARSERVVGAVLAGTATRLVVVRPSNNYGPWQFPDNLIPKFVKMLANGEKVPLYGNGEHRRSWVHVDDTARAVVQLLQSPEAQGVYNIGGEELSNRQVVQCILDYFGEDWGVVETVEGRPINDLRYCNDESKLVALGYTRSRSFHDEITGVLEHYAEKFGIF